VNAAKNAFLRNAFCRHVDSELDIYRHKLDQRQIFIYSSAFTLIVIIIKIVNV